MVFPLEFCVFVCEFFVFISEGYILTQRLRKPIFNLVRLVTGLGIVVLTTSCQATPAATLPSTPQTSSSQAAATYFQAPGTIGLSAAASAVKKGQSFEVEVVINTTIPIRGAQWTLKFDPAALRGEAFEEGSFLKNWADQNNGSTLVLPEPKFDNQNAEVSQSGIAILSQSAGGVSGQGVLGVYRFTALVDAPPLAQILKARVADENGNMSDITIK
jgi:hypothetical protein